MLANGVSCLCKERPLCQRQEGKCTRVNQSQGWIPACDAITGQKMQIEEGGSLNSFMSCFTTNSWLDWQWVTTVITCINISSTYWYLVKGLTSSSKAVIDSFTSCLVQTLQQVVRAMYLNIEKFLLFLTLSH